MVEHTHYNIFESLTTELNPKIRDDFFFHLDADYFTLFSPEAIVSHMKLSAAVNPDHPAQCKIERNKTNLYSIAISAYDYFSEFSIICGLITSFGLEIESGRIFTFTAPTPGEERNKILDIFIVRPSTNFRFGPVVQRNFKNRLEELVVLLDQNQLKRAREIVNQGVFEYLALIKASAIGKIYPVRIRFRNRRPSRWTSMEIVSRNTPAFLYAFSNALSMQNINISRVNIKSQGRHVNDILVISHASGGPIKNKKEQTALRIASTLTKQFTYFLSWAPNPAKALQLFEQFLDKVMEKGTSAATILFLSKKKTLNLLARVLGASEFLWEDFLQMQYSDLLPILKHFRTGHLSRNKKNLKRRLSKALKDSDSLEVKKTILNKFKDRELFRFEMRHLLAPQKNLPAFSLVLTELTEAVLEEAWIIGYKALVGKYGKPRLENKSTAAFAIFGLGKFGGKEIGYASDIELLLVYGGEGDTDGNNPIQNSEFFERLGHHLIFLIESRREGIFHVDLRLRPFGSKGSLTNSVAFLEHYYSPEGGAAPFERQALIKLRWITGNKLLGRKVEEIRDKFTYSGAPWDLKSALALRKRQIKELVQPNSINVKYSPGGVIDLEYAVQYDQIIYGAMIPKLRTPSTLEAIDCLFYSKLVSAVQHKRFRHTYLFLRMLIDSLRVVRGNARDLILPDWNSEEFKFLARRMGYLSSNWERGAKELKEEINRNMRWAHKYYMGCFKCNKGELSGDAKSFSKI